MLRFEVEHRQGEGYIVEVTCNKGVRHLGISSVGSHVEVLDMLGEVLLDYRS